MIARLTGTPLQVGGGLVIDVDGVGYRVSVPASVFAALPLDGGKVTLLTRMLVREDDISLYGFTDEVELRVFELLLTVSGIGPKVALALLSALSADDLSRAVASEDVRTLTKVPGVGAKTAQRMVLELREKLQALGFERRVDNLAAGQKVQQRNEVETTADDVIAALLNLGYNRPEAKRATDTALEDKMKSGPTPAFSDLLRAALNRLTK